MNSRVSIEPLELHRDARGLVLEPLGPEAFPAQRNAHLVLTEPGCIRGNHHHPLGTEVAVVLGPALVRLREEGVVRDIPIAEGQAFRLTIPPGVAHAFQNTGTHSTVLVAFNTVAFDPAHPDLVRDVLIPT
ncbi:MAG: hypothetical protein HYY24_01295 [Verrucomicrobia bacterium]|nr:hypothetical protein [Verrucomicrobiota bacterium]